MQFNEFAAKLDARQFPIEWPGHWIGGEWIFPKKTKHCKTSFNPSRGTPLIEVRSDRNMVSLAIENSLKVTESFAEQPLHERLETLRRFQRGLGDYLQTAILTLRLEAGKPSWEAEQAVHNAMKYMEEIANTGEKILENLLSPIKTTLPPSLVGPRDVHLMPSGIVAAYLPFSTAMTSFAMFFSSAILTGCPLVIVSSAHATLSAMLYSFLAQSTGVPAGTLNVVFGDFDAFKQVFIDRRIATVLFAGSPEHCHQIRSETRLPATHQLVLQAGGKNPAIVHESADMKEAIEIVAHGALRSAGQLCTSTSRVFVHSSKLRVFCDQLVEHVSNYVIGPTDEKESKKDLPMMGPLYSHKAIEKFLRFQTMAHRDAKETLLWGKSLDLGCGGYFVSPGVHLLKEFDPASSYQNNILFCPDIGIFPYDDFDDVARALNTCDTGFVTTFIGDPDFIRQKRRKISSPNLLLNMPTTCAEETFPLSGRSQSGLHLFNGSAISLYLGFPQVMCARMSS